MSAPQPPVRPRAPAPFRQTAALVRWLSQDFLGGPKVLRLAWVINAQKAGTVFFVGALMWLWGNFSPAAWVYLGLHGSYGIIWLIKDVAMPDPRWQARSTLGGGLMAFVLVLGPYWFAPVILITDVLDHLGMERPPEPSGLLLGSCIFVYALGVVIMMVSDAQKYFTLKVQPGLITTGMFRHIRHPNYLGEMLVYGSFAALVQHWIPWAVLGWVWGAVFLTNIVNKEASMSRYPEWADYKRRSGLLWPWPMG